MLTFVLGSRFLLVFLLHPLLWASGVGKAILRIPGVTGCIFCPLGVPVGPLNQSLLGQRALRPIEGSNPAIYIDLCLRLCSLPSPYYPVYAWH